MSSKRDADARLMEALDALRVHDHASLIYKTRPEQLSCVIPFIRAGISHNDRCLYLAGEKDARRVRKALTGSGLNVDDALSSGTLSFRTIREGSFEGAAMGALIRELRGEAVRAGEAGFRMLRVAIEAPVRADRPEEQDHLATWEGKLHRLVAGNNCLALCQYSRKGISPEHLLALIQNHQVIIAGGRVAKNSFGLSSLHSSSRHHAVAQVDFLLSSLLAYDKAHQKAQSAEERYLFLLDKSNEAIFVLQDARLMAANRKAIEFTGYSEEELLSLPTILEIVHPGDREKVFKSYHRRIGGEEGMARYCFRIRTKKGEIRWAELSGGLISWKGRPAAFYLITDVTQGKLAEEALRTSEERYRNLVEKANETIIVVQDGKIRYCNPKAAELSGYPEEEIYAKPFMEFVHPDDRPEIIERYRRRLEGKHVDDGYQFRLVSRSRGIRWVQVNAMLIEWEGRPAILDLLMDVTDLKMSESLLSIQHEMAMAMGSAGDLLSGLKRMLDIALQIQDIDCGGVYVMHDAGGPHEPGSIELLAHAGLPQEFVERVSSFGPDAPNTRIVTTGVPVYSTDRQLAEATGRRDPLIEAFGIRSIAIVPVQFEGRVEGAIMLASRSIDSIPLMVRQILEGIAAQIGGLIARARIEKALRMSEERLRGYFNLPLIGVSVVSNNGSWLEINGKLCSILGYSREELMSMNWMELTPPEDYEKERKRYQRFIEGPMNDATMEKRFIKKDGSLIDVELSVHCVRLPDGTPDFLVAICQDITDRKKSEEILIQALKMESVGRLAGGVAHDLNNLLTPILGYSDILQRDLHHEDPRYRSITQVCKAAESAKHLTQQLLAFSRRQVLEMKVVDLNTILSGFEKILRRTIREDVEISISHSSPVCCVNADIGQIEQILMNIAVNAQDAMPEGGTLSIRTDTALLSGSRHASNPDYKPGRYVLLEMIDTGTGMDAQTLEHIFEPFFTTKKQGMGTGLGLSTIYGIVKQHGGFIDVSSEKDRGSCFRIFLPQADGPACEEEEKSVGETHPVESGRTVLIAEDNEMVRALASEILGKLGYTVVSAGNARECIESALSMDGRVDLLLTDVIMPDMNGRDLYVRLSSIYPHVRVVYMSGYPEDVIAHHGVLHKDVDFVQKPFSARELTEKIRQSLERVPAAM